VAGRRLSFPFVLLLLGGTFLLVLLLTPLFPRTVPLIPPFSWVVTAVLKISEGYHDLREGIRAIWRHYLFLRGVSEERDQLLEENRELRFKVELLTRELLIRKGYEELWGHRYALWDVVGGRVVYQDPADLYRDLWIHVNAPLSPNKNYVVLSPEGVVGRVIRVAGSFAQVLSLLDPDSAVDVITPRGTRGIAQGVGKETGRLRFVARGDPLERGEELLTTGKDRFFPPNLLVGWVERVQLSEGEIFQDVEIRFATDFRRLIWVKVLEIPTFAP
jgi:rod shape-determining protein MreC